MSTSSNIDVHSLTVPVDDGAMLVQPSTEDLARLVEENRRLRGSYRFELLGRPATELMEALPTSSPVVLTGHQPTFIHPGVWIKGVVAGRLAREVGGQAAFLMVDSDAVHRLALSWPEQDAQGCRVREVLMPVGSREVSFWQMPPASVEHWRALWEGPLSSAAGEGQLLLRAFCQGFLGAASSSENQVGPRLLDYVDGWVRGMREADRVIGLQTLPVIRVSGTFAADRHDSIAHFLGHLLLYADEFADSYNSALAEYRSQRGIRSRQHPVPDLTVSAGRVELPLWLAHGIGPRLRLFCSSPGDGGVSLWAGPDLVCTLSEHDLTSRPTEVLAEALGPRRLLPRALILTMYARLFACDLFIHGIGGAKYDQITDEVIRLFFGVEPPAYACVSATLRLPLRLHKVSERDRASARRQVRDLAWNPQRGLIGRVPEPIQTLAADRASAVEESDRLRRERRGDRISRQAAFHRIRQASRRMTALSPERVEAAQAGLDRVERLLEDNRIAASREWFFAFYPVKKLQTLISALSRR